jgi:hypothetical protein
LYYIHTDHLGSTSLMSDADGQKVETSVARYLPYGRWRTEPTTDLTDWFPLRLPPCNPPNDPSRLNSCSHFTLPGFFVWYNSW